MEQKPYCALLQSSSISFTFLPHERHIYASTVLSCVMTKSRSSHTDSRPQNISRDYDDLREEPLKASRVAAACDECRNKKIKCDGVRPSTHTTSSIPAVLSVALEVADCLGWSSLLGLQPQ